MLFPKTMIVEQLRARGDATDVERAERELGEKVDTERDAELLAELQVDAQKLRTASTASPPRSAEPARKVDDAEVDDSEPSRADHLTLEYKEGLLMKAARFYGPGDIRIEDVPEPRCVRARSRSRSSGAASAAPTCTSTSTGPIFAPPADSPHPLTGETVPVSLGHEFAGVVPRSVTG